MSPLLALALVCATTVGAPADALRHLEYDVAISIDGKAVRESVNCDILSTAKDGSASLQLVDQLPAHDPMTVRTDVDQFGTISAPPQSEMTYAEVAVVTFVALESEDLAGMEQGNKWERESIIPGGRQSVRYSVLKTDNDKHLELQISRTVSFGAGNRSSWRGVVEYNPSATVPTAIILTGRIRQLEADQVLHTHDLTMTIKLANDSFKG